MVKEVYCPKCLKKGKRKLLCRTNDKTEGRLYLWCKSCKEEVIIDLNKTK